MVIKTEGWLSGRKVLIVPQAVETTYWLNRFLKVNLTKKQSETSSDINTD